jgi:hypothetical protein
MKKGIKGNLFFGFALILIVLLASACVSREAQPVGPLVVGNSAAEQASLRDGVFFSRVEGQVLLYSNLDNRGRVDGYTRQTIRSVDGAEPNYTINYSSQTLDKNRRPVADSPEVTFTIKVEDHIMEVDMKSFTASNAEVTMEISGEAIRYPALLNVGDKLPDVNYSVTIVAGLRFVTNMTITGQEVLAIENVAVPAGVFRCYKITQTSRTGGTATGTILTWQAPNVGLIKSETYNRGRLVGSQVLQSIE